MSTMMKPGRVLYNLGPITRVPPGEGRSFLIGETAIAIFHTRQGEVFATQAGCTHKSGPLADGLVGDGKVVCPLHAFKFNLANGEPIGNACAALKTYPVSMSPSGDILLELAD